jgi:hypothetical protein
LLSRGDDDDDDVILKTVAADDDDDDDDDVDRKDEEDKCCRMEFNPFLDILVFERRKNAVDVSSTENLAAVINNNGREIIIICVKAGLQVVLLENETS